MAMLRSLFLVALIWIPALAAAQQANTKRMEQGSAEWARLEKQLWDVEQQWLCSSGAGPYHKDYKECIEFRDKFWSGQFFEISVKGQIQSKKEMIAAQTAAGATHVNGVGPYPRDFKLQAVYGNIALATDQTDFKTVGADGKLAFTSQTRVLRIFVKENGKWIPAGAALVPIVSK